jgi:hypothetical protein
MKHEHEFSHNREQEVTHQSQRQDGHEFAGADELLRFDAEHTIIPPEIAQRLQQSSADIPPPRKSWWKNLLGQ